ncbi:type VI secretion system contractile sheath small subunit [Ruegeria lacuscaerulensis]|uniref:type VI secretion system contractile sheath small subunit n=1 Tax=Ruegeria lacuscaerulensis TaxID=55218 RepID=UPI0014800F9B
MADNSQKFIARNRAPRVQIEYDVELYGAEKTVQLPFVMGVMSDLSGKSKAETPSISDRKFLEIDVDNFDDRMKAMAPRVEFAVPNTLTGEGNLSVDLTFEKMSDFSPAQIASKIEPLQKLLEARTQLATLLAYMDGKAGAEALIEKILADPALLATLANSPVDAQDSQSTLDALREMAPEDAPQDTAVADALASLPEAEDTAPRDETSDVLSELSAAAPESAPEDTTVQDALASVPDAVEADAEPDVTAGVLSGLANAAPDEVPQDTAIEDALASIPETEEQDATDDSADILSELADAAPEDEEDTSLDDLLGDLADMAPDEDVEDTSAADALASLPDAVAEEDADDSEDILSDLADAAPEDEDEDTSLDDLLGDLADMAPDGDDEDISAADALASLPDVVAEEDADDSEDILSELADAAPEDEDEDTSLDDLLGDLADMAPDEDVEDTSAADALASLPDAVTEDDADDSEDILSGIAAAAPEEEDEDSSLDDLLGDLADLASDDEVGDESDDILSDLSDATPDEEDEDTSLDDLLGDLADMASDDDEAEDSSTDDALASLPDVTEDEDDDTDLDDLLTDLTDDSEEADEDETDDILSALPDIEEEADADDLDDILGDLADTAPEEDEADDLDALLSDLSDDSPEEDEDTSLDGLLDDLTAEDEDTPEDDLDALLADDTSDDDLDLDSLLADDADEADDGDEFDLESLLGDDDEPASDDTDDFDLDSLLAEDDDTDDAPTPDGAQPDGEPVLAFGRMSADRPEPEQLKRSRFRIAIFGDFSGRAARGQMETGDALAARAPILLDPDTVEDVISGFATTLVLPIGKDGAGIEVKLTELDDLHPDELYEKVELFEGLSGLKSQLGAGATAEHAAKQLTAWGEEFGRAVVPPRKTSGGNTVRADLKLSDFQKLIGDTDGELAQPSPVDDLLKRVVGPHIRKLPSPDVAAMKTAVDEALSAAMRMVLHHPEFQSIEAQWRSLDLIARSVEDDDTLDVILYDVSAEEIGADLASEEDLAQTGLVRLLTEEPLDEENGRGGYSALIGLYTFEETPPHAELLGRIGRVAAHVDAPFISAITPAYLDVKKEDRHPLVVKAWDTFRAMPEAGHVGLASPRFLLRRPYGAKSEPIYEFEFEEFTQTEGLRGMLWANPAVLVTILLARSFKQNGKAMNLGSVMSLSGVPYHFVNDRYGDQVALPCTERNLSLDKHEHSVQRGYMPVLSVKGRDEIRLGSFNSVAGQELLGPWSGVPAPAPSPDIPAEPESEDTPAEEDFNLDDLGLDDDTGSDDDASDDVDDLDDFLASFDNDTDEDEDDDEMDPELAALLADL